MPRGNDAEAAVQEFDSQYGIHQNAEELRVAHQAALDREVAAASLKREDEDASKGLDLSQITPSQGGTVLSAAVRGGQIVYVAEGNDGRSYKGIVAYEPPSSDED